MNRIGGYFRDRRWCVALLLSALAAGCGGDGGRDPILGTGGNVVSPPTVIDVAPASAATDVSVTTPVVTTTFSEPMSPITGSGATFTVTCASPCVTPPGAVTLDSTGTIASYTFTGGTPLASLTVYTATVTGARSLATGLALTNPRIWSFTTGAIPDITRPRVTLTVPATTSPGPTAGVATNSALVAVFSERMAPATMVANNFTLTCASPCVAPLGAVSYVAASKAAVFTPQSDLEPSTTYTATVTTGATDLAGNALAGNQAALPAASNYIWTFTTSATPDTTRPSVTVTTPATTSPGPTPGVTTNTAIIAAFNDDMSPATLTATSFTVTCATPCVSPTGTVNYEVASRSAVFAPAAALTANATYTATITTAATDLAGNALAGNQDTPPAASNYVWTFTTGATADTTRPTVKLTAPVTTTPGPTPTVVTNTSISAFFSEDMAPATIGDTSFTLTCSSPCVPPQGSVSYVVGTKTAVFTPVAALAANSTYTATITTAATDLAGNTLSGNQAAAPAASNYVWTFTTSATVDATRPAVTVTAPITTNPGPTTGVSTNIAAITAAFSEDMAPATMNSANFTVTCASPCTSPVGSASYVVNSKTLVFTPAAALTANTTYTATVSAAATDLANNALGGNQALPPAASSYVWTFETGAAVDVIAPTVLSTNPADAAIGVCINKTINATFSESMDPLTVTDTTFLLSVTAGAPVTGIVAYDISTNIATFDPAVNLTGTPATSYTATIVGGANGVKDVAGNALAADKVTTFTTNASSCTSAPPLGAAAQFGSFGGNATLTNDGLNTIIHGDVGVHASSTTITGLRDSGGNVYTITTNNNGFVDGLIYTLTAPPGSLAGAGATQARVDALAAFNSISPGALPGGIDISSLAQCPSCGGAGGGPDELGGRTLPPGVYMSTIGTYDIGGPSRPVANLTLDAGGDADAVWVFQTAAGIGTLTVGLTGPATPAVPIQVLLINGAQAANVFWYVPAGATIGTGSTMVGTMLADASITLSTTGGTPPTAVLTTLEGRAIALTAAVTMTNTIVNVPAP